MTAKKERQYGVVDVGSNSVRLSVYVRAAGTYPLRKVFDEKQVVGLAAYVNGGLLNDEGIRAAAKVVKRQAEHARLLGCENLSVFATAAMRNCSNSKAAVKLFSKMIDLPVDLVSGPREAELGFVGIRPEFDLRKGYLADIGGGSTEVSVVRKGRVAATTSLPFGSLSLWSGQVAGVVPTRDEFEACRDRARQALSKMDTEVFAVGRDARASSDESEAVSTLYGIGGTIRTVAKMWAGYAASGQEESQRADTPDFVSRDQLEELGCFALERPGEYGHLLARIEPTRIHTAATGMAVLIELLDWTGAQRVRRSKHGIREGYVLSCML